MNTELLQFLTAKGAGDSAIRRLLSFADVKGYDAATDICVNANDLTEELGLKRDVAEGIVRSRESAQELNEKLLENKVELLWLTHAAYPERLRLILGKNAPPLLFSRGNKELLKLKSVGFCGSRKASEKGLLITSRCAAQIVERNYTVVSGYAHGVDMSAHRTALENGGTTIIVLVDGLLRIKEKKELKELLNNDNHLFLSQFPPMLTWMGRNAMKRNGTIIGLSDGMILVESGLQGGTFAAGQETLDRKMPLFVIDFADPGPSAEANPFFIEQGGIPIRGNKQAVPNLSKLFDLVEEQQWRTFHQEETDMFNFKKQI